jgi:hypothetical protein
MENKYEFNKEVENMLNELLKEEFTEDKKIKCSCCGNMVNECDTCTDEHGNVICDDCRIEYYYICDICGKLIHEDDMTYFDNTIYCSDCVDSYLCECDDCGELFERGDGYHTANGRYICGDCRDNYVYCRDCDELYHEDDIYWEDHYAYRLTDEIYRWDYVVEGIDKNVDDVEPSTEPATEPEPYRRDSLIIRDEYFSYNYGRKDLYAILYDENGEKLSVLFCDPRGGAGAPLPQLDEDAGAEFLPPAQLYDPYSAGAVSLASGYHQSCVHGAEVGASRSCPSGCHGNSRVRAEFALGYQFHVPDEAGFRQSSGAF